MTLKERLDAVWEEKGIVFPCHLVRWSEKNIGYYKFANKIKLLFYTKGKRLNPKRKSK
jgi:hypothetical protein